MPSLANSALRLLGRLLGARPGATLADTEVVRTLDGNTAVAIAEAGIAEAAGLGAGFPADTADLAWRAEQQRYAGNLLGGNLSSQSAEGPRGALAASIGLALSGIRASCFLSGPDLARVQDLISLAAGRRLPLVIHVACRSLARQGAAVGSGHEALHLSADHGGLVLIAANVQEAVDFTLIGRHLAERCLLPVLVAMDGPETALALQDVHLPSAELAEQLVGDPAQDIESLGNAQRLLFGEHRRRLPRWHDPDRPVLLGGLQAGDTWALGAAAGQAYLSTGVNGALGESFAALGRLTGRNHAALSTHQLSGARLVLLAQGAAVETAEAVADHLHKTDGLRIGVLGLRSLRPFPAAELVRQLQGSRTVLVLERLDQPLGEEPPLTRELRGALQRAAENAHVGRAHHQDYPELPAGQQPRVLSVHYGLGGLSLRGADLIRLCREAEAIHGPQVYLGLSFNPGTSVYPKRQVLLDRLHRAYPGAEGLGLRSADPTPDLRPQGALTLALHRVSGGPGEGLAPEAGGFLNRLLGGCLRSHPGLFSAPWGEYCVDRLTAAPTRLRDPGDQMPVDLALLVGDPGGPGLAPLTDLRPGGALLVADPGDPGAPLRLPFELLRGLEEHNIALYRLAGGATDHEHLLGALCGVLLDRELLQLRTRRVTGLREEILSQSGELAWEARLGRFSDGLEQVRRVEPHDLAALPLVHASDRAPQSVRRLARSDDAYDSLPRFWDQVGVLYRDGHTEELCPEPYLALGAVPPLSSSFRDLSPERSLLPRLNPAACTGCGACWSACPEGAIGATALSPARLLEAGIRTTAGSALQPLTKRLATAMTRLCRGTEPPRELGDLLDAAWQPLLSKSPPPAERREAMQQAMARLTAQLDGVPAAVTETLFSKPEAAAGGSGALLLLAVNPRACKGCGICTAVCEPAALEAASQSPEALDQARRVWTAWEQLPTTPQSVVQQAAPEIGRLPAALLAAGSAGTLAGGDGAEPGSGARLTLRLALAAAEQTLIPRFEAYLEQVRELHQRIAELIRQELAQALPANDLDSLAERLGAIRGRQTDLGALLGPAQDVLESAVDTLRLRRLVDLARGLGDLEWRLAEGRQGLGRARLGAVLTPGATVSWAGAFPANPFAGPVVLDPTGDGPQLAAGLLEGQLRQAAKGLILLRKARLELERPDEAVHLAPKLDSLGWQDLSADEQACCPSMLLVGDSGSLGGPGLAQLVWLLGSRLPLRVLLLADLDLGLAEHAHLEIPLAETRDPAVNLGLLALAQRGACIAQSSLGAPEHLAQSLEATFAFPGPALLHVHAPSPQRHGFDSDRTLERARQAVAARVLPLFRYHPRGEGVFGSRIALDGNPEPYSNWAIEGPEDSGEALTPAHWAQGERRFAGFFTPLAEADPHPLALADWLALAEAERAGKTPYVTAPGSNGERRLRVDRRLARISAERQHAWRTLQELAGLVTPFTARVRAEAEAAVAADRQTELAALKADYELRIQRLRDELQDAMRHDMRERLLQLAGYGPAPEERPQ